MCVITTKLPQERDPPSTLVLWLYNCVVLALPWSQNSTDRSELHHFLGIPDAVLKLAHLLKPVQEKGRCAAGEMYPQRDLKSEMMLFILEVKSRRQQVPPIPVSWTHSGGLPVQSTRSAANDLKALRKWQWCVPVVTGLVFASVCACAGVCMGGALWL